MYYKEASVRLAVQLLDDTEFRYGDGSSIRVSVADFKPEPSNESSETQKPRKALTEDEKRRKQTKFRKLDECVKS